MIFLLLRYVVAIKLIHVSISSTGPLSAYMANTRLARRYCTCPGVVSAGFESPFHAWRQDAVKYLEKCTKSKQSERAEVPVGGACGDAGLHLDGLEVDAGVDGVQLAVQGVEGGPLGGLGRPAAHHHAVDVLGAAGGTRQPEPGRQQVQNLLVVLSCRQEGSVSACCSSRRRAGFYLRKAFCRVTSSRRAEPRRTRRPT